MRWPTTSRHKMMVARVNPFAALSPAVVLLATDALGPADREEEWCWISGMTPRSRWLQVGLFYIPLVVAFGVSVLVYLRVEPTWACRLQLQVWPSREKERSLQVRDFWLKYLKRIACCTFPKEHMHRIVLDDETKSTTVSFCL